MVDGVKQLKRFKYVSLLLTVILIFIDTLVSGTVKAVHAAVIYLVLVWITDELIRDLEKGGQVMELELYILYSFAGDGSDQRVTIVASTPEILRAKKRLFKLLRLYAEKDCGKPQGSKECMELRNEIESLIREMDKLKHDLIARLRKKKVKVVFDG